MSIWKFVHAKKKDAQCSIAYIYLGCIRMLQVAKINDWKRETILWCFLVCAPSCNIMIGLTAIPPCYQHWAKNPYSTDWILIAYRNFYGTKYSTTVNEMFQRFGEVLAGRFEASLLRSMSSIMSERPPWWGLSPHWVRSRRHQIIIEAIHSWRSY